MSDMFEKLVWYLLDGDYKKAVIEVNNLLLLGVSREEIVTSAIEESMLHLDDKCTVEHFNLLEIMLVGRASMEVMKVLYPQEQQMPITKGTVAVAALEGDVHDIGKNIAKMILTSRGYKVIDCGKDCSVKLLIDILEKEKPMAVGIAGLTPTVIQQVQSLRGKLNETGKGDIKIVAGGASLKQLSANYLNADAVVQTAFDLERYLNGLGGYSDE
jgi:methanogenic corrinoid protein MtbC1